MPEIGQAISHYKIIEKLGHGGLDEVSLAQDTFLDCKVALKFLAGILSGDPQQLTQFEHKAKLLRSIHHPNAALVRRIRHRQ